MFQTIISIASRYRSAAYVLSAAVAFMWAAQHPFTSMFYRALDQSLDGVLEALLITELMYIILYLSLGLTSEGRKGVAALQQVKGWFPAVAVSAVLALIGLSLYIISQGKFAPTQLSFVLNASPLSSIIVALFISKQRPNMVTIVFNLIFLAIAVTITYLNEEPGFFTSVTPSYWLLAAMVPMFYFASAQMVANKFAKNNSALFGGIIVANAASSCVFAVCIATYLVLNTHVFAVLTVGLTPLALFFVGTALSSVMVRIVLHILLEIEGGSQNRASIMYNLTPVFTVLISYFVYVSLGVEYIKPKGYEFYILVLYSIIFLAFPVVKNHIKRTRDAQEK